MFGISFPEMTLILVIAVIALGPEKLPKALVEIAKYFKVIKKAVNDAKSNFEQEVKIAELKEDAKKYRDSIENATNSVRKKLTFEELDEIKKNLNSAKDSLNKGLSDLQNDLNSATSTDKKANSDKTSQNSQEKKEISQNQSAIDKLNSANFDDETQNSQTEIQADALSQEQENPNLKDKQNV